MTYHRTTPIEQAARLSRGSVGGPGAAAPDYASARVGSPLAPYSAGRQPTERVRISILALVLENWIPFTSNFVGRFIGGRAPTAAFESPFDLDSSERITRWGDFPSGSRPFPYPYMIGAVSGFMAMQDALSMSMAWGKTPSGPGVFTPIPVPFDITYPTLPKVTG